MKQTTDVDFFVAGRFPSEELFNTVTALTATLIFAAPSLSPCASSLIRVSFRTLIFLCFLLLLLSLSRGNKRERAADVYSILAGVCF